MGIFMLSHFIFFSERTLSLLKICNSLVSNKTLFGSKISTTCLNCSVLFFFLAVTYLSS